MLTAVPPSSAEPHPFHSSPNPVLTMKRTPCLLPACAIAAFGSNPASGAVTLLDDHFNDGSLGTNPGTGGGFGSMGNGVVTAGSVTESGSQARILEGTSSNTYGILSSNAFDISNSSLSYTVTWSVAKWTSAGSTTQAAPDLLHAAGQ